MKLIKLSETHYIVVDDSEIKEGHWFYFNIDGIEDILQVESKFHLEKIKNHKENKKITHSTKPLENINFVDEAEGKIIPKIKPLSLSEVEELIYGYSVDRFCKEKVEKIYSKYIPKDMLEDYVTLFTLGFNTHKELVKDKLFTIEDMRKALWCLGDVLFNNNQNGIEEGEPEKYFNDIIQSLLPKTEWEVEFDEQGKLKLI